MKSFSLHTAVGFFLLACLGVKLGKGVCYGKYGCFTSDDPFNRMLVGLPDSPEEIDTKFYLYTQKKTMEFKIIDDSDGTKLKTNYDGRRKTYIIIHGWTGKPLERNWVQDMKNAFLFFNYVNVIVVDWSKGASSLLYLQAVANSRLVGAQVAQLIKFLNEQTKNAPDSFHIVGFSLGAHVSGYAGKRFHDITNTKIGRITGLDPACPEYEGEHNDVKLDKSDADFVDVIHTDSPLIGTPDKSGHFDFWPNGGEDQPGCEVFKKKRGEIPNMVACEHYRAHQFFLESLKSQKPSFLSYRCESWEDFSHGKCMDCNAGCPEMGYNAVNSKGLSSGNFYLFTNGQSPYNVPRYMYLTFQTIKGKFGSGYNPRVRIYGTKDNTGVIKLKGQLEQTNHFVVPIKTDLGKLKSIAVKNDVMFLTLFQWDLIKVTAHYVGGTEPRYTAVYGLPTEGLPIKGEFISKPLEETS